MVEQADPLFEFPDELIELVRTHGARHAFIVDEQNRRLTARAKTLRFLEREGAIRRGFAEADAQLLLQMQCGGSRTLQRTRQIRADRKFATTNGREIVHRVEARDLVYRN